MEKSPYEKAIIDTVKPKLGDSYFLTQLLGRLQSDLLNGAQPCGHLWGLDFQTHIATMKAIFDSLNPAPCFISRKEIQELETRLAPVYAAQQTKKESTP